MAILYYTPITSKEKHADSKTAHEMLHQILRKTYHIDTPTFAYNEHGKPYLSEYPDIFFNLSHSKSLAVCLIGNAPLGVDTECRSRGIAEGVMRRTFDPKEIAQVHAASDPALAFATFWTLKESFVKAMGIGISYPMETAVFQDVPQNPHLESTDWKFQTLLLQEKHVVSLCLSPRETLENIIEIS